MSELTRTYRLALRRELGGRHIQLDPLVLFISQISHLRLIRKVGGKPETRIGHPGCGAGSPVRTALDSGCGRKSRDCAQPSVTVPAVASDGLGSD